MKTKNFFFEFKYLKKIEQVGLGLSEIHHMWDQNNERYFDNYDLVERERDDACQVENYHRQWDKTLKIKTC